MKNRKALFLPTITLSIVVVLSIMNSMAQKRVYVRPGSAAKPGQHKWALIIGINNYMEPITDLDYAVSDAQSVYNVLIDSEFGGFEEDKVKLLTDSSGERPTRRNILKALKLIESVADDDDTVFIFFSGHGIEEGGISYFLPIDADVSILADTGIPMERFTKTLNRTKAKVQVMFFDACHSGARKDKSDSGRMSSNAFSRIFTEAEGRAILSSCGVNEVSWDYHQKGYGVFTYYLLDALKGKADLNGDEFVTVSETSNYVTEKVKEWSFKTGKKQNPRLDYNVSGDIVLTLSQEVPKPVDVFLPEQEVRILDGTPGHKPIIEITLNLKGNYLYVDDKEKFWIWDTSQIIEITEGQHTLSLRQQEVILWKKSVTAKRGKKLSISLQIPQVDLTTNLTEDVRIEVDGKFAGYIDAGKTETILIPKGRHTISLKGEPYDSRLLWEKTVEAAAGETIQLTANIPIIELTTNQEATIFIDDKEIGETVVGETQSIPIQTGSHTIALKTSEYRRRLLWEETVEAAAGEKIQLIANLFPLSIRSNVWYPSLYINGQEADYSTVLVPNGTYTILARKHGCADWKRTITIDGKGRTVYAELEYLPKHWPDFSDPDYGGILSFGGAGNISSGKKFGGDFDARFQLIEEDLGMLEVGRVLPNYAPGLLLDKKLIGVNLNPFWAKPGLSVCIPQKSDIGMVNGLKKYHNLSAIEFSLVAGTQSDILALPRQIGKDSNVKANALVSGRIAGGAVQNKEYDLGTSYSMFEFGLNAGWASLQNRIYGNKELVWLGADFSILPLTIGIQRGRGQNVQSVGWNAEVDFVIGQIGYVYNKLVGDFPNLRENRWYASVFLGFDDDDERWRFDYEGCQATFNLKPLHQLNGFSKSHTAAMTVFFPVLDDYHESVPFFRYELRWNRFGTTGAKPQTVWTHLVRVGIDIPLW